MVLKVFISQSNSIYFNLALEHRLLRTNTIPTLFLWKNDRTVVLGRHQNAWKECKPLAETSVALSRRFSGGGCVYQDLGNSCFSFIHPSDCKPEINQVILGSLESIFGIKAEAKGRNDLVIRDRKFSGSAFSLTGNTALHHGTIMRAVDIDLMESVLTPDSLKLSSKGIDSVRSRVINLTDIVPHITHENLCSALIAAFQKSHGLRENPNNVVEIDEQSEYVLKDSEFLETSRLLQSWDWIYGKTPAFVEKHEFRVELGSFEILLDVKNGVISDAKIFSDVLVPNVVESLTRSLIGVERNNWRKVREKLARESPELWNCKNGSELLLVLQTKLAG